MSGARIPKPFAACLLVTVVALVVAGWAAHQRRASEGAARRLAEKADLVRESIRRESLLRRRAFAETSASALAKRPGAATRPSVHSDIGEVLSEHPQLQMMYQLAVKGRLHQTYDRFLAQLGLSKEQIERVVSVLETDDEDEMDLAMTAQSLGLQRNDPALREFRHEEKAYTQTELQSILGPDSYAAMATFDRSQTARTTAEDVAGLVVVSSPMTGEQTDQLTQILAQNSAAFRSGREPDWETTDWQQVISNAAGFLNPTQLDALRAKVAQARSAALVGEFYGEN